MNKEKLEIAHKLGLLSEEYEKIISVLGREPNITEISIFSSMWSEHCSYKNSVFWIKQLPRDGENLLAEAGEENAGLIAIDKDLACVFKIESHNHPSAIEPFQGAATGVGGINRDIFTMGARPIAQLNSLRFGNINTLHTQYILKGVVKGISRYGNSFGIPTVGGEVAFDDCYEDNPLVNALSAGIVKIDKIAKAISYGKGNSIYIIGALTGKDGINGASFASKDLDSDSMKDLPSVQIGDPFQEKLLLEASLEIVDKDLIIGMQDMGAAGIICSTSEMSAKGKSGMEIHLEKVPMREKNMLAAEILLSESQERMLIISKPGKENEIEKILQKWEINYSKIGEVTDSKDLEFYYNSELVAKVPANDLVLGGGAPVYKREYSEPNYIKENKKFSIEQIVEPKNLVEIANFLIQHPNIASKNWITKQYDYSIGASTLTAYEPCDAALVKITDTQKALALTIDCNSRYVWANPKIGASIAVAEAARNIVCAGAKPLAITNCLNFGNPYNQEVYWQFVNSIMGIKEAAISFKTPVTGGNVSFYNQSSNNKAIFPTPTIGMLGILEDLSNKTTSYFRHHNDIIYLIGESKNDINASEYLYSWHKVKHFDAPYFNLNDELLVQKSTALLINKGLLQSAHDISDGGLFITLLESAMHKNFGVEIKSVLGIRKDAFLFGESQSRVIVSIKPNDETELINVLKQNHTPYQKLGHVSKNESITIDGENFGLVSEAKQYYQNSLAKHLN